MSGHPTVALTTNSFTVGGNATPELRAASMASHLEHLATVLRDPNEMAHMTRDEQLSYVKFALDDHSRSIVETA